MSGLFMRLNWLRVFEFIYFYMIRLDVLYEIAFTNKMCKILCYCNKCDRVNVRCLVEVNEFSNFFFISRVTNLIVSRFNSGRLHLHLHLHPCKIENLTHFQFSLWIGDKITSFVSLVCLHQRTCVSNYS